METNLPEKALNTLVETACDTFKKVVYPITAATEGAGRLIESKFDTLVGLAKLNVSEVFHESNEKIKRSSKKAAWTPKPKTICDAIDGVSFETDSAIKELWSNLIAQECIDGSVHPEVVNNLRRMDSSDAFTLKRIAEQDEIAENYGDLKDKLLDIENAIGVLERQVKHKRRDKPRSWDYSIRTGDWGSTIEKDTVDEINRHLEKKKNIESDIRKIEQVIEAGELFSHEHLIVMGLVKENGNVYRLTNLGKVFIKSVNDPI